MNTLGLVRNTSIFTLTLLTVKYTSKCLILANNQQTFYDFTHGPRLKMCNVNVVHSLCK